VKAMPKTCPYRIFICSSVQDRFAIRLQDAAGGKKEQVRTGWKDVLNSRTSLKQFALGLNKM
jgi:hypothetical protein